MAFVDKAKWCIIVCIWRNEGVRGLVTVDSYYLYEHTPMCVTMSKNEQTLVMPTTVTTATKPMVKMMTTTISLKMCHLFSERILFKWPSDLCSLSFRFFRDDFFVYKHGV